MTRIFDAFMFKDEFDILECRIVELEEVRNLVHILVEADVDHQDHPKPYHFEAGKERFAKWADRIIHVKATGLPTARQDQDPWSREHAQREWIRVGLTIGEAKPDDMLLQSDVDEIPRALQARNVRTDGMVAFAMRGHFWAVDWLYPEPWMGTVAAKVGTIAKLGPQAMGYMRDCRNTALCPPSLRDAGWHLSWLGGDDMANAKVESFCHTEVSDLILKGVAGDRFKGQGWHCDGKKMVPVDVDGSWPKWIREGNAPANWYRTR